LGFFSRRQGRPHLSFSSNCENAIRLYPWPGNLRELRNAVERATILSPSTILETKDLGLPDNTDYATARPFSAPAERPCLGGDFSISEVEREHIARVVTRLPSFDAAAQVLGIDATTLQRKRKRYGLA